jgi:hypothetical protein
MLLACSPGNLPLTNHWQYSTALIAVLGLKLMLGTVYVYMRSEKLILPVHCSALQQHCLVSIWAVRVIFRSIAEYLVEAWDVRNTYKHNGAVLPVVTAPVGRGADGVDAMA